MAVFYIDQEYNIYDIRFRSILSVVFIVVILLALLIELMNAFYYMCAFQKNGGKPLILSLKMNEERAKKLIKKRIRAERYTKRRQRKKTAEYRKKENLKFSSNSTLESINSSRNFMTSSSNLIKKQPQKISKLVFGKLAKKKTKFRIKKKTRNFLGLRKISDKD